jgi:hypothetical protein
MFIPIAVLIGVGVVLLLILIWVFLLAAGRNPLPFPDPGSRIFSASSKEAKDALVALLSRHGLTERFQMDSSGILRSLMMDGTIINVPPPEVLAKLEGATSCVGLVAQEPEREAREAAKFLQERGFSARVVLDAEPNLPIAFVLTDAFRGSVLNFRKHATKMPRPK